MPDYTHEPESCRCSVCRYEREMRELNEMRELAKDLVESYDEGLIAHDAGKRILEILNGPATD